MTSGPNEPIGGGKALSPGDFDMTAPPRIRSQTTVRRDKPPAEVAPSHPFVATAIEIGARRRQTIARFVLMAMAFALVVPVVLILVYLFVKAWPILSISFLLDNPAN